MSAHAEDEKLLIHCFQESLAGDALEWYNDLDSNLINSWGTLYDAFIHQYRHNVDTAPTRSDLERMAKKNGESFKEYAKRWRAVAARVRPHLLEKEMTGIFISTLKTPFIEHLLPCASMNFRDMIITGDRVEEFIRKGIVAGGERAEPNKRGFRGKEVEVAATINTPMPDRNPIFAPRYPPPSNSFPLPSYGPQVSNPSTNPRPRLYLPPLPAPPSFIFQQLLAAGKIQPIAPLPAPNLPHPASYKPDAFCEYHSGSPGHSTNSCLSLRRRIQSMIDQGDLQFAPPQGPQPNIHTNPLPNHQNNSMPGINVQGGNPNSQ